MPQLSVGMNVMVDMAGFEHGGVSMGSGVSMGGTITAIGPGGITVKLHGSVGGIDTVTVAASQVAAA